MGKYRKVCFGFFSLFAIADIIAFSIMYSPVMEKERHNQILKTYIYYQDCLVYNISINHYYYTLKVNNSYYHLDNDSHLNINSTVSCFISPISNIAYLNIEFEPNQIALIFLLIGMLGLFITGSLLKVCIEHKIIKFEDKKFKSRIANQILQSIQNENNNIQSSGSIYQSNNNETTYITNENSKLIDKEELPKFYDISLIRDEYEDVVRHSTSSYKINNVSHNNLNCNICNKELFDNTKVRLCLEYHYYCRSCILNLDKDICILCQKPINFEDVKIYS